MDNIIDVAVNELGDQLDGNRGVFMDYSRWAAEQIARIDGFDPATVFGGDETGTVYLKAYLAMLPYLKFIQNGVDSLKELNGITAGGVNVIGDGDQRAAEEFAKALPSVHVRT